MSVFAKKKSTPSLIQPWIRRLWPVHVNDTVIGFITFRGIYPIYDTYIHQMTLTINSANKFIYNFLQL